MQGIIKYTIITICTCIIVLTPNGVQAQGWEKYVNPEEAGFNPLLLSQVETTTGEMNTASYLVTHRGRIVTSYGDITRRFMLHSMRKSLISALYGIYEAKGLIDLSTTLEALDINDKQGLSATERSARIEDLLSARSGIYHPAAYEPESMQARRPERGSARPGEQFFYNNWDFNTLATIFELSTGEDLLTAFEHQIAKPIGMEDFRSEDAYYRYDEASVHPAYLYKMSARDLARFGQLILKEGRWNSKQIIPQGWISKSTALHSVDNETGRFGYGYLWWIDNQSFNEPCIYASGVGGQRIYIFPNSEMVIVHQVNTYLFQKEQEENIIDLVAFTLAAQSQQGNCEAALEQYTIEDSTSISINPNKENHKAYAGIYHHPFFKEIKVNVEAYGLSLAGNVMGHFRIFEEAMGEYKIEDLPEMRVRFEAATEDHPSGHATSEMGENRVPKALIFYY